MENLRVSFAPAFDPIAIRRELDRLLVPGVLADADLEGRIVRLDERFRAYAASAPHGLWAQGLVVTDAMRRQTEIYLPLAEIRQAFRRLFSLALTFSPCLQASLLHTANCWLDVLTELHPLVSRPNPAALLRRLMADEELRCRFLFASFLPRRYGGAFGRYPGQAEFLRRWLGTSRARLAHGVRCLDAACGCGEGTYELARLVLECGYPAVAMTVTGATLEPLELFAAAHGFFPHDAGRQAEFIRRVEPRRLGRETERIRFVLEDLRTSASAGQRYDVILCNGVLGGPFFPGGEDVAPIIERLAGRLAPGGVLLAADRFHAGWKRALAPDAVAALLRRSGLRPVSIEEGVGGVKG
jgi:chemotaxis methyl-accepting protein methylase